MAGYAARVAVERSGSCRDTIGQFARQPCPDAPKFRRLSKSFSLSRFLIFNSAFLLARSARALLPNSSFFLLTCALRARPSFCLLTFRIVYTCENKLAQSKNNQGEPEPRACSWLLQACRRFVRLIAWKHESAGAEWAARRAKSIRLPFKPACGSFALRRFLRSPGGPEFAGGRMGFNRAVRNAAHQ